MIREKNKQWQVRVYAGRDPLTGAKRFEYHTAPNERAAKKLEARLMTEIADGRRKGTGAKTVADLIERWLEWRKTNGDELSPATAYNYERDIELRIIPALGRLPLRDLDSATLDDFYGRLRRHGGRCQRCARRIREGLAPMRAGERFEPRPGAPKQVHEPDCAKGFPLSASKVHQVHAILSGALQ